MNSGLTYKGVSDLNLMRAIVVKRVQNSILSNVKDFV